MCIIMLLFHFFFYLNNTYKVEFHYVLITLIWLNSTVQSYRIWTAKTILQPQLNQTYNLKIQ